MAGTRLRIAHIIATTAGAAWLVAIAREQVRRGHDVHVILPATDGPLAAALAHEGIPTSAARMSFPRPSRFSTLRQIRDLAAHLRALRPDVVQCHLFGAIVLGRLAAWAADVPRRYSMIPGPYCLESSGLAGADTATAWTDTSVIASCEWTRTLYEAAGVPRDKLEVVYYGLDPTGFDPAQADRARGRRALGLSDSTPVIGLVAYFYPPARTARFCPPGLVGRSLKGHDVAIAAMQTIRASVPDARLVFVGGGFGPGSAEHMDEMRRLAVDMGVGDAVMFTGHRDDIPDMLAAFDVVVHCSRSENLGGSIEALTMARPFVATRVGGLVDTVIHEQTGLLVPRDDAAALAASVLRLLGDRELAGRLGENGRRLMLDRFTVSRTASDLDRLYAGAPHDGAYRDDVSQRRTRQLRRHVLPFVVRVRLAQLTSPALVWSKLSRAVASRMTRAGTP